MNLFQLTRGVIGTVNPDIPLVIVQNTGYTTAADGKRTPTTNVITGITGQMQNLSARELQQIQFMNLESDVACVWVNGNYSGIIRAKQDGGDLFMFNNQIWLAVQMLETWPDWCRVAVCLQGQAGYAMPGYWQNGYSF